MLNGLFEFVKKELSEGNQKKRIRPGPSRLGSPRFFCTADPGQRARVATPCRCWRQGSRVENEAGDEVPAVGFGEFFGGGSGVGMVGWRIGMCRFRRGFGRSAGLVGG